MSNPTRHSTRYVAESHFRHSGWAHVRRRVLEALHRTKQSLNRIRGFEECGYASYVVRSDTEPYRYRLTGSACRDRFCTPCARERARNITNNALEILSGKPVRFVTLTVRTTTETLAQSLAKLDTAFAILRRRAFWRSHVVGAIAFTEVKWIERTQRWHPHLHVLTHGRYMDKSALKAEWRHCTDGSDIVDIRLVRERKGVLQYVTKYAGKGLDSSYAFEPDRLDEAVRTLKGRRLLAASGDFRGHPLTDAGDGEEWEQIGSLWEFLQSARDGDLHALHVLAELDANATSTAVAWLREHDPPPRVPPTITPEVQERFAYTMATII